MNKEKFHFEIPESEIRDFEKAVKRLVGKTPHWALSNNVDNKRTYTYFLTLSKYELLYLRLAVKGGSYLNLSAPEDQQTQSDTTQPQMA